VAADTVGGTTGLTSSPIHPIRRVSVFRQRPPAIFFPERIGLSTSLVAANILDTRGAAADLSAFAYVQNWVAAGLEAHIAWQVARWSCRRRPACSLSATERRSSPQRAQVDLASGVSTNWDDPARTLDDDDNGVREICLDRTYPGVIPGSWAVLESPSDRQDLP